MNISTLPLYPQIKNDLETIAKRFNVDIARLGKKSIDLYDFYVRQKGATGILKLTDPRQGKSQELTLGNPKTEDEKMQIALTVYIQTYKESRNGCRFSIEDQDYSEILELSRFYSFL